MKDKIFVDKFGRVVEGHIPDGCHDIECYIRKDALLEWLNIVRKQEKELLAAGYSDMDYNARLAIVKEIINKINSL